jgi:hypothetical protein
MNLLKTLELDKTVRCDSEYNGEKFYIDVRVNTITIKLMQQLKDAPRRPMELAEALDTTISAWDLNMGDDKPFPPIAENIAILPEDFVGHLVDLVLSSVDANKTTEKEKAASA